MRSSTRRQLGWAGLVALLALAYFAAGKLGLALTFGHPSASAIWPPTGLALAATLLLGRRAWPGVFLGAFLVNFTTVGNFVTSLSIAGGNTLESLLAAALIERFAQGARAFERARHVVFFFLSLTAGALVSASVGVGSLHLGGFATRAQLGNMWFTWLLGDIVGGLLVTPPVVLWTRQPRLGWTARRGAVAVLLFGLLSAVAGAVFLQAFQPNEARSPLTFLCLPFLVLLAFQFGPRECATGTLLLAVIAIGCTVRGLGPFANESAHASLLVLQVFLGITAITKLLLAGVIDDLRATRAEARFRGILESAPDAMVIVNATGAVVLVNAQTERMFGYQRVELIDQPVEFLIPERFLTQHIEHRRRYFAQPGARPMGAGMELWGRRKNGQEFPVEISLSPLSIAEGTLVAAAIRDISERREIERKLRQTERLAAIGEMMTGLAHESRNALQRIQASLELLALRTMNQPDLNQLVAEIQRAQDLLLHLYEQVRSYAAPVRLRHEVVHLGRLIHETWRQLEPLRRQRDAILREEPAELDPMCLGDPLALGQVFRNVLENSLAVCADPVVVTVSWRATVMDGRPGLEVSLRDNGPGFPADAARRIFEPFFTTRTQGTGLGLAIAKRIIEAHGARIETGEAVRPGAEIRITFLGGVS